MSRACLLPLSAALTGHAPALSVAAKFWFLVHVVFDAVQFRRRYGVSPVLPTLRCLPLVVLVHSGASVVAQVQPAAMQDRLVSHRPVVLEVLELVVLFPEQQHITQEVVEVVVIIPLLPATEVPEEAVVVDLAAQLKVQAVLMEVVMEHLL